MRVVRQQCGFQSSPAFLNSTTYLDPALSIVLSLAIAAAAWPVGKAAAWTLLEGAPVEADDLEGALGKVAVVEACALLHLRDEPVDRAGLVRLRLRRGDKRRRSDVVTTARRVLSPRRSTRTWRSRTPRAPVDRPSLSWLAVHASRPFPKKTNCVASYNI